MGTKNDPGKFDCYANAKPDEPMFVLLGRDRFASTLVHLWVRLRGQFKEDSAMLAEATACAESMDRYCRNLGKIQVLQEDVIAMKDAAIAELVQALANLLERIDKAGGLGPYTDGPVFVIKRAEELISRYGSKPCSAS